MKQICKKSPDIQTCQNASNYVAPTNIFDCSLLLNIKGSGREYKGWEGKIWKVHGSDYVSRSKLSEENDLKNKFYGEGKYVLTR